MSSIARSGYKGRNFHKPDESQREINERVQKIAKDKGVSMAQVSIPRKSIDLTVLIDNPSAHYRSPWLGHYPTR
jgi:hypothetical protein